jgi:hypothetical protein
MIVVLCCDAEVVSSVSEERIATIIKVEMRLKMKAIHLRDGGNHYDIVFYKYNNSFLLFSHISHLCAPAGARR